MVKKILLTTCIVLGLASCSAIDRFMPSDFDNVEYDMLVELNVISKSDLVKEKSWCHPSHLSRMAYLSTRLEVYATHRLNENIVNIYKEINSMAKELRDREDPSNTYCKIKRQNIHKITADTLSVFGSRK